MLDGYVQLCNSNLLRPTTLPVDLQPSELWWHPLTDNCLKINRLDLRAEHNHGGEAVEYSNAPYPGYYYRSTGFYFVSPTQVKQLMEWARNGELTPQNIQILHTL